MRILHLIDLRITHGAGEEPIVACRAAVEHAGHGTEHRIIGVGPASSAARAAQLGLALDGLVSTIGGAPELAARRLRALLAERESPGAQRPWADIAHCWSAPMLGLVRLACGRKTPPRVGLLVHPRRETGRLGMMRDQFALHDCTLACFDRSIRASWAEAASARRGGRLLETNIRLLDAPVWTSPSADASKREQIRRELGLKPGEIAIALIADPPSRADASRFVFTLGLLYTMGHRVVGIAPRGTRYEERALRFVRRHGRRWGMTFAGMPMHRLLAGCDAAMWDADAWPSLHASSGPVAIASAMSAGVPVACGGGDGGAPARALMGDQFPELIARDGSQAAIADRLLNVVENAAARQELSRRAVAWAEGRSEAFAHQLLALWQESANVPVPRPGLPMPVALVETARRVSGVQGVGGTA